MSREPRDRTSSLLPALPPHSVDLTGPYPENRDTLITGLGRVKEATSNFVEPEPPRGLELDSSSGWMGQHRP